MENIFGARVEERESSCRAFPIMPSSRTLPQIGMRPAACFAGVIGVRIINDSGAAAEITLNHSVTLSIGAGKETLIGRMRDGMFTLTAKDGRGRPLLLTAPVELSDRELLLCIMEPCANNGYLLWSILPEGKPVRAIEAVS